MILGFDDITKRGAFFEKMVLRKPSLARYVYYGPKDTPHMAIAGFSRVDEMEWVERNIGAAGGRILFMTEDTLRLDPAPYSSPKRDEKKRYAPIASHSVDVAFPK